jgi:hypothetical protein
MKSFVAVFILTLSAGICQAQEVGTGGILNSPSNPILKMFTGADTANIKTYDQAKAFCKAQGNRRLPGRCAWCKSRTTFTSATMYDGLKETEEWVPITGINAWLQIGKVNGATTSTCKTYREAYGIPEPGTITTVATVSNITFCQKPADCNENKCAYTCPHAKGYYPDPTDCRAYCHCSGGTDPSWWETVTGTDLIWDPYCADSNPLDSKNKPLG